MPITMQQVLDALSYIEPRPQRSPNFGPDALPHLEILLDASETFLAAKAAYAISQIQDPQAVELLRKAARDDRAEVRIAAAGGARNLASPVANDILVELLDDQDGGVRKFALKSVNTLASEVLQASPELRTVIENLSNTDVVPTIRQLSREVLQRINPSS